MKLIVKIAAACDAMPGVTGWVPYVEANDLATAVAEARSNGASILAESMEGLARVVTIVTDPGGAPLALWKRAEGVKL